jgi:hypothetical protein
MLSKYKFLIELFPTFPFLINSICIIMAEYRRHHKVVLISSQNIWVDHCCDLDVA